MKRYIIALIAGAAVFALAFGSAAALDVDAGTIQAGGDTELECDPDGVDVLIGFDWSDAHDAYIVTGFIVSDIAAACSGGTISLTATDVGGFEIETMFLGGIGDSATLTPAGTIKVEDLYDVHVLIVT